MQQLPWKLVYRCQDALTVNHKHVISFKISPFKDGTQTALFKDPDRTAQQTLFISVIKTNQFML